MGDHRTAKENQPTDRDTFNSYTNALSGPLLTELDPIECEDEKLLMEFSNFDPIRTMELLIKRASAENTPPERFHREIKSIITFRNRINRGGSGYDIKHVDIGVWKKFKTDWLVNLESLEKKYGISEDHEPTSITITRLNFMFPHHYVALPSSCYKVHQHISVLFQYPEFGGLIPTAGAISLQLRKAILLIHMYCLTRLERSIHFRTHHVLLNRRIQTGLLSDDRRIRFLVCKDVLIGNDKLSPETEEALEIVRSSDKDFESRILWDLLRCC